jgi:starch phosphorylase
MNTKELELKLKNLCAKEIALCSNAELYSALLHLIEEESSKKFEPVTGRKLYYISAEFLIGKLLSNNLINLNLYDTVKEFLEDNGKSLAELEEFEVEPSLGNGGLGRLSACFLDSLATLNLPGDGIGLRYHCGLFHQNFKDNAQFETPDYWLSDPSWAIRTEKTYSINLAGKTYSARLYQIAVTGYEGRTNHLNLFDLDTIDPSIIQDGIYFDKTNIEKNLTLFLYPDDSDEAGRLLRIYQQYLMVSAGAQFILEECMERGSNLHDLEKYAAIQINDTHPSMVIPELIRLLCERGISFDEAVDTVTKVCAYTNHTILSEALEKWPRYYLEKVVPQLLPIIERLDYIAKKRTNDCSTAIIDEDQRIHMAHMDIHFSHSTNGVASLHTDILKDSELHNFYRLYPEKFNNKTNGITFRRWLLKCNPELTNWIESLIGPEFKKDASHLEKLLNFTTDERILKELVTIKKSNKIALADWLKTTQGVTVNPNNMFAIQSKRLHEYKRQQLNLLYLIHQYYEIKAGNLPATPLSCIFGAKAAPAYTIAKDIIHALLTLSKVIENDPVVSKWLQIVFVENYNVTAAEKMIPACDLSEQISLASKEASGTGNMKFMLNGALTLGTMDGANVEIAEAVGSQNIYIFGQSSKQVIDRYNRGDYCSAEWYEADPNLKRAVDFLISEEMLSRGNENYLARLHNELIYKDWFQTMPDFNAYIIRKNQALCDYKYNRTNWASKTLINISKAGFFSSDRTIQEYNSDIWHL